jgi:hypothetical protein
MGWAQLGSQVKALECNFGSYEEAEKNHNRGDKVI